MQDLEKHKVNGSTKRQTTNFLLSGAILLLAWTITIGSSLLWNIYSEHREAKEHAAQIARSEFNRDLLYRRWNANLAGVYVHVSDETKPNPYLKYIENRDLVVSPGDTLTLMNPAYMTRQVHELGRVISGMRGHITSLNPIRPENRPDAWEKQALHEFELGRDEVVEIDTIEGAKYLRYMQRLVTEETCLKCHAQQGYKVGDIRGGISVSIPMAPHEKISRERLRPIMYGHIGFWLLGATSIGLFMRNLAAREREAIQLETDRLNMERKTMASQKMESLGIMASGVAHDFNNKLSVILGNLEMTMMDLPEGTMPSQEMLEIEKAALESAELTKQLLGFARQQPVAPKVVDMNELAAESMRMIRRLIEENVQLSYHPAEQPLNILIDPLQFDQIMTNLILNARDAVGEDGRVDVSTEEVLLEEPLDSTLMSVPSGNYFVLEIMDNGSGIPKVILQNIIEPFFTTKPIGKGTGLGLPMVYGIVKQNKGYLQVETELGEGTTVRIYFPPYQA